MTEAIRIVIGTEPRTEIARKVLEYSILKHTKSRIDFHSLMGQDYYDRGKLGEGTGFSLLRFSIPEMFNYQGRAIYLDADMLVLSDINNIWQLGRKPSQNIIWCKYGNEKKKDAETSVMLIDCKAAKHKLKTVAEIKSYLQNDSDRSKYREIMKLKYLDPKPIELSRWWNVMDKGCVFSKIEDFSSPNAKLLHYTNVRTQPWYYPAHPKKDIWGKWLKRAVKEGRISMSEIREAVKKFDISNTRRPNGLHPFWEQYLVGK